MDPLNMDSEWLKDRENLARKLELQNRPPEEKKTWYTTFCPHCNKKIEYSPRAGFEQKKIQLRCPHCGRTVTITPLDEFWKPKEKEK